MSMKLIDSSLKTKLDIQDCNPGEACLYYSWKKSDTDVGRSRGVARGAGAGGGAVPL